MGFFTKFGDGACDLAPLSGLVKNQVRSIARHFGAPESLVEKIPTADLEDLSPGKPDEASHGVTYAEIDAFLHGEARCGKKRSGSFARRIARPSTSGSCRLRREVNQIVLC